MSHLLSLSELHAAAPGVLDVVFGADGEFEGAPEWRASLWARKSEWGETEPHEFINDWAMRDGKTRRDCPTFHLRRGTTYYGLYDVALDLRVRSVAARLATLCCRAADPRRDIHTWQRAADLADRAARCEWPAEYAATLSALCIDLAPRIRDLSRRES